MASNNNGRAERLKELRLAVGQLKELSGSTKLPSHDLKVVSTLSDRFSNLLDNLGETGTFSTHLRTALKQLGSNFQERVERLVLIDTTLATRLITAFLARVLTDETPSLIQKEAGEADPTSADQQREVVALWEDAARSAGYGLAVAYSNAIEAATAAKGDTKPIVEARDVFYSTLLPVVLRTLANSPDALLSSDMVYFLIFIVDGGVGSNRRLAQKLLAADLLGKALSRMKDFQQAFDFASSIVQCMPKRDPQRRQKFAEDVFGFLGTGRQSARDKLVGLLSEKLSDPPGQRVAATLAYLGTVHEESPQRIIIDRVVAAGRPEWLRAQQAAHDRDTHDLWINQDGIVVEVVGADELRAEGEPAESWLAISFAMMESVVASFNDAQPSLLFNTSHQLVPVEPASPANSKLQFFLSKEELKGAIATIERRSDKVVERRQSIIETEPSSSKPSRGKSTGSSKANATAPALPPVSCEAQMDSSDQQAGVPTPAKAKSKELQRAGVTFDELPQELSEKLPMRGVPSGSTHSRSKHFESPPINTGSAYEGAPAVPGQRSQSDLTEPQSERGVGGADQELTQSLTTEESQSSAPQAPGTTRRSGTGVISVSSDSASEHGGNGKKDQKDGEVMVGRRQTAAEMAEIEEAGESEVASHIRERELTPFAPGGPELMDDDEAQRVPFVDDDMPPLSPIGAHDDSQEAALEGTSNKAGKAKEPTASPAPVAAPERAATPPPSVPRKIAGSPRRSPRIASKQGNKEASVSEGDTPSSAGRRSAPNARAKKIAPDPPASLLSSPPPDTHDAGAEAQNKQIAGADRSPAASSDAKHGSPARDDQLAAPKTRKRKGESLNESEEEGDKDKEVSTVAAPESGRGTRASMRAKAPPAKRAKSNSPLAQEDGSPPPPDDDDDRGSDDAGMGKEGEEPELSLPLPGSKARVKLTKTFKSREEKRAAIAERQRKSGLGVRNLSPMPPPSPSPSPEAEGSKRRSSPRLKRQRGEDDDADEQNQDEGELTDVEAAPSPKKRKPVHRTSAKAASTKPATRARASRASTKAAAPSTKRGKKGKSKASDSESSETEKDTASEMEQDDADYDDLPGARPATRGAKAKQGKSAAKKATPKPAATAAKRKGVTKRSAAKKPAGAKTKTSAASSPLPKNAGTRKSARKSEPARAVRGSSPAGAGTTITSKMRAKDAKSTARLEADDVDEEDVAKPERPRPRARAAAKAKDAQAERNDRDMSLLSSPPPGSVADKLKKSDELDTPARSEDLALASSPAQPAQPQRGGAPKASKAPWMSAPTAKLIERRKESRGEAVRETAESEGSEGDADERQDSPTGAGAALAKRLSSPQAQFQPYEDDEPAIDLAEWVHNGTDDGQGPSPLPSPQPGPADRPVGRHEISKADEEHAQVIARKGNAQQIQSPTQAAAERRRLSQAQAQAQKAAREQADAAASSSRRREAQPATAAALRRSDVAPAEDAFAVPQAPLRTGGTAKPLRAVDTEAAAPVTVAPALLTKPTLPVGLRSDGAESTSKSARSAVGEAREPAPAVQNSLTDERRDFVRADDGAAAQVPRAARQARDSSVGGMSALFGEGDVSNEEAAAVWAEQIKAHRAKKSTRVEESPAPAAGDKSVDRNKKICEMYLAMDEHDKVVMRTLINSERGDSEAPQDPQPGAQQLAEVVISPPPPPSAAAQPQPASRAVETRRTSPSPSPAPPANETRPATTEPVKASSEPIASPAPGETPRMAQRVEVAQSVPHAQAARQMAGRTSHFLAPPEVPRRDAAPPKPTQRSTLMNRLQSQETAARAEGSNLPDAIRAARELGTTAKAQQRAQRAAEGASEQRILSCCEEIKAAAEQIIDAFTNQTARVGTERLSQGARELQGLRGDFALTFRDLNLQSTDMMDHLSERIAEAQASATTFAEASTNTDGNNEGLTRAAQHTEMLLQAHTSNRGRLPQNLF